MLITAAMIIVVHVALIYVVLHYNYNRDFRTQLYLRGHIFILGVYMAVFLALGNVFGGILLGVRRKGEVMFSLVFTILFSNFIFYLEMMMLSYKFPTPVPLLGVTGLQMAFCAFWTALCGSIYQKVFRPYDVLLIYDGSTTEEFLRKLCTRRDQFNIVDSICAKEDMEKIQEKINKNNTVILWDLEVAQRNKVFKYCYDNSKRIFVNPKISDIILNGSRSLHLFDTPLLLTEGSPLQYEERVIKRAMDVVLAIILLVLSSPIMLVTAILIKCTDGGPVLYKQIRCTKGNREFEIYKFRSMIVNAEKAGTAVLAKEKDDRITPVGKVIRKVRIDELPQLFNVLKGDMSFVGPRPERPEFIEKFMADIPEFSYRTKVLAGLTGYAQLYGKYNTRPYDKLKLDLYYIEQYSVWLDLKLIILTAKILFTMESTEGAAEDITAGVEIPKLAEPEAESEAEAKGE